MLFMESLEQISKRAERNLNAAHADFKSSTSELEDDFRNIRLQALIFQYEVCHEMGNIIRAKPEGFALSVALKGLVHKLYEYDRAFNSYLFKRTIALATARGIKFDKQAFAAERKKWRNELKGLAKWSTVRNKVTGHYDPDLSLQVQLIEQIHLDEVIAVFEGFLQVNVALLKTLRDAGKGAL